MFSRAGARRLVLILLGSCCPIGVVAPQAVAQRVEEDVVVTCVANDHEIFDDLIAYQLRDSSEAANQHLVARRLEPAPPIDDIREDTVFAGPALDLDSGLAPISRSGNGPEPGFDINHGVEIVYTKESETGQLFVARCANSCVDVDDACWDCRVFANADAEENRWKPGATRATLQAAKVAYHYSPGTPDTDVRVAWRELEDADLDHEHLINDPNVAAVGAWARIGNRDFLLVYGPPDADQQVAIYALTPPFAGRRLQVITSGPGSRSEAAFRVDPTTGRPTVLAINTIGSANVMEVYQRIGTAWIHLYDFDAASVGETDPELAYIQSPEPFVSANRLWVAFVTSDTDEYATTTKGNIRIARLERNGPPTLYRALNDETVVRKRIEPEIHYTSNDGPVVFYTQRAEVADEEGCNLGDSMLRRARTRLPL
jgi:hypothetical protein